VASDLPEQSQRDPTECLPAVRGWSSREEKEPVVATAAEQIIEERVQETALAYTTLSLGSYKQAELF